MTPLELELTTIGREAFPATPAIAEAVGRRVEREPAPRRLVRRHVLALAAAVVLVGLAAAFAVPQARSTILDWLGFEGGVTVERVGSLPAVPAGAGPEVGVRMSLAEARRRVAFPIVVPTANGLEHPDAVYLGRFAVEEVTLLFGHPGHIRALLTEADGELDVRFAGKLVGAGSRVDQLRLNGAPALWIEGAPHEFFFRSRHNGPIVNGTLRLARNTLLWQRGRLVLRLEGEMTRAQALEIARSVR